MTAHSVQVKRAMYYEHYDDFKRFLSYQQQISFVKQLQPRRLLEIGIGNGAVTTYLRNAGYTVITCDFDASLKPDVIADIRKIPIKSRTFDAVMACQVLEHIPFDDVENTLCELKRITKKHLIISLPYAHTSIEVIIRIPLIGKIFKRDFIHSIFRISHFFRKNEFCGEHYWEIGRKGYPIHRIRKLLKKYFVIEEETSVLLNPYHHFFLLRKN